MKRNQRLHMLIIGTLALAAHARAQSPNVAPLDSGAPEAALILKDHPGWVLVPGEVIRPDCVHEIPKGAQVEDSGDITLAGQVVAHYDRCPEAPIKTRGAGGARPDFAGDIPGTGDGWVEDIHASFSLGSGDNISLLESIWTVPKNPTATGGVVFLWNGIEPSSGGVVMQPVLQWGAAGVGSHGGELGGNYWVIASWLAHDTTANSYHSPGERVSPGDLIQGETQITSTSAGKINWEISAQDLTSGAFSDMSAWSSGDHWTVAYAGVLEGYGISSCTQLPSSIDVQFQSNLVNDGYPKEEELSPNWNGYNDEYGGTGEGPACGYTQLVIPEGNFLYW
jgi:hypothetical protein